MRVSVKRVDCGDDDDDDDERTTLLPSIFLHLPFIFLFLFLSLSLSLHFSSMRPLILHSSALNNAEYDLYTSSLKDIALLDDKPCDTLRSDSFYDDLTVSVREARAWLRGRYSSIEPLVLDSVSPPSLVSSSVADVMSLSLSPQILRLFSPSLSQSDMLNGGQFFAMLRLVTHVLNGAELDKNLVFVQGMSRRLLALPPNDSSPCLPAVTLCEWSYSPFVPAPSTPF